MCKYYIGYSTNSEIRFSASSGGIGTAIIKYLLSTESFGTTITFQFNREKCQYEPKLIYNYGDYNNCGSIYQDIPLVSFLKSKINEIREGIVITCMPCQVKPIRNMLDRRQIKYFIISLCCSGQTTVEGTWYYYKLLKIDKKNVIHMQYRGNGWPSGIKITMNDGNIIRRRNYTYPWTLMHKSLLFRPKRCLFCTQKTTKECDISLADPWLKEYIEKDKIGNSIVIASSDYGDSIIKKMTEEDEIETKEINESIYVESQLGTIESKAKSLNHRIFNKIVSAMGEEKSLYKKIATSSVLCIKAHNRLIRYLYKLL